MLRGARYAGILTRSESLGFAMFYPVARWRCLIPAMWRGCLGAAGRAPGGPPDRESRRADRPAAPKTRWPFRGCRLLKGRTHRIRLRNAARIRSPIPAGRHTLPLSRDTLGEPVTGWSIPYPRNASQHRAARRGESCGILFECIGNAGGQYAAESRPGVWVRSHASGPGKSEVGWRGTGLALPSRMSR